MQEEKRKNNTVWYRYGEYAFRVSRLASGNAVVWVNFKGYNLAFSMMIRDFLHKMDEYSYLDVGVNCQWNEQRGFEVKQGEEALLIGEILYFCEEHEPKMMNLIEKEKYLGDEWDE